MVFRVTNTDGILVGGFNVYISPYPLVDGGGGQHRLYIVVYSVQRIKLSVSKGGVSSGGGLMGITAYHVPTM